MGGFNEAPLFRGNSLITGGFGSHQPRKSNLSKMVGEEHLKQGRIAKELAKG